MILDQFEPDKQSQAPNITHTGVLLLKLLGLFQKIGAHILRVFNQVVGLVDRDQSNGCCTTQSMAGISGPVAEKLFLELVTDVFSDNRGP